MEKIRIEFEGVPTIITNGRETWRYDPQTNTVTKNLPDELFEFEIPEGATVIEP